MPKEQQTKRPHNVAAQHVNTMEHRLNWLEKEVDILERKIEFYDALSLKIKG